MAMATTGKGTFTNPEVVKGRQRKENRDYVDKDHLVNVGNITGDLDGLTGDARFLTGDGSSVTGHIPEGLTGCLSGFRGSITELPQGRKCTRITCRHCNPKK